ncbi:hypothetical protein GC089_00995 [Cellulomonas sp. JZ18]|uniref:hypothetical protein n=1 Tax=Cellulomonas sp. JZ18 TaxID=2654191 RepID=UPI0012D42695|nr:hypothetical protein [Cellulomonas sp. JZ18]QGQ18102.1 hypothetical protein GC089_00995 [Cellulomonas sp. JZ18]
MAGLAVVAGVALLGRGTAVGVVAGAALLVAAFAVVAVAAGVARAGARTAARHAAVQARRRKAEVVEVWGAVGLWGALGGENARRATVHPRRATALSLAVGSEGLELWSGAAEPVLVHSLRWPGIEGVAAGSGALGRGRVRPAVVVVTRAGNRLVLVPARRAAGAVRTASEGDARALADRLDGMRAALAGVDVERARETRRSGREAGRRRRAGG